MDDRDLTILTKDQSTTLEVLQKYGFASSATDLCLLTGGLVSDYFINEDKSLKGRSTFVWTNTKTKNNEVYDISGKGNVFFSPDCWRSRSIRPVLKSHSVFSEQYKNRTKGYNGTEEVEYGEYPQEAVPLKMQRKLESEYTKGMKKTGRSYTFDKTENKNHKDEFEPIKYEEYEYQDKKYIRVKANTSYGKDISVLLSNGAKYKTDDYVWIEVTPVKWLIDEETESLISKRCLVSGIRFPDIKEYLNKYMIKDLTQSEIYNYVEFNLMAEKSTIEDKKEEIKKAELEKLILAKQKIKEAAELLNSPQDKVNFDRIKVDNLRSFIFKNNGNPTEKGYIEFDDFFRDNAILRIIDLSKLELDNVNITNMDFSGTNIHIDPQAIYNKDMTGVNASDVSFSPFLDIFDDVILNGAIINDSEALIDLDRLKSYDENTVIGEEANSKITR